MALTTFDYTFDFTFDRAAAPELPTLPEPGGDGLQGVGGAAMPFAQNPALLASCRPTGQGWERWAGVPISRPNYLMPFVLAVPMPDDLESSPWCVDGGNFVDADTGEDRGGWQATLFRMTDGNTLYIINIGEPIMEWGTGALRSLSEGVYRLKIGPAYSAPFAVKCGFCDLLEIRMVNDTRIGDLLYGSYGFQQRFLVEGELTGPTYEEIEERSGDEKTGGQVRKVWTLRIEDASESVADALSMAGLHKVFEVSYLNGDGSILRSVQALSFEAKPRITPTDYGAFTIEVVMPVSSLGTSVKAGTAQNGSACLVDVPAGTSGAAVLTPLDC
ncbi:hypothetical protein DYU11_11480 [Fibrisoma montanum]|uniref:Uncharacterized protein n=1 Tax=Fibrisoma montanum TaxID=2305895 RepID=A0A418MB45_9BACT|nr:hypothetical protein [Fibrisoma montanum]RIV23595.1 hypothetical protein DYU11_11480 [Fibrisoma montanum]